MRRSNGTSPFERIVQIGLCLGIAGGAACSPVGQSVPRGTQSNNSGLSSSTGGADLSVDSLSLNTVSDSETMTTTKMRQAGSSRKRSDRSVDETFDGTVISKESYERLRDSGSNTVKCESIEVTQFKESLKENGNKGRVLLEFTLRTSNELYSRWIAKGVGTFSDARWKAFFIVKSEEGALTNGKLPTAVRVQLTGTKSTNKWLLQVLDPDRNAKDSVEAGRAKNELVELADDLTEVVLQLK